MPKKEEKTKIEKKPVEKKIAARSVKNNVKENKKTSEKKKSSMKKDILKKDIPVEKKIFVSKKINLDKSFKDSDKKSNRMIPKESKSKKQDKPEAGKKQEMQEDRHFAKWVGRDFFRSKEETLLYYLSLVAGIVAILFSIRDRNWLSLITFATLFVVVVFELRTESKDINYEINIDGILIGDRLYKFEEIRSFEISRKGDFNVVKLQLRNSLFPMRELYLDESQDIAYMQALLEYFLPEEKQEDMLFNFKSGKKLTEDEFIDQKVNEYLKGKF